jgi:hypothetical protein
LSPKSSFISSLSCSFLGCPLLRTLFPFHVTSSSTSVPTGLGIRTRCSMVSTCSGEGRITSHWACWLLLHWGTHGQESCSQRRQLGIVPITPLTCCCHSYCLHHGVRDRRFQLSLLARNHSSIQSQTPLPLAVVVLLPVHILPPAPQGARAGVFSIVHIAEGSAHAGYVEHQHGAAP